MEEREKSKEDEMYCWSCGSSVKKMAEICPNCGVRVSGVTVSRPSGRGSGWLLAGGILGIIAGVFALIPGIIMVVDGSIDRWWGVDWAEIGFGISFLTTGTLAIVGSSYAITVRNFGLSLMGGICALWPNFFLGVPALILIAISRDSFPSEE